MINPWDKNILGFAVMKQLKSNAGDSICLDFYGPDRLTFQSIIEWLQDSLCSAVSFHSIEFEFLGVYKPFRDALVGRLYIAGYVV